MSSIGRGHPSQELTPFSFRETMAPPPPPKEEEEAEEAEEEEEEEEEEQGPPTKFADQMGRPFCTPRCEEALASAASEAMAKKELLADVTRAVLAAKTALAEKATRPRPPLPPGETEYIYIYMHCGILGLGCHFW